MASAGNIFVKLGLKGRNKFAADMRRARKSTDKEFVKPVKKSMAGITKSIGAIPGLLAAAGVTMFLRDSVRLFQSQEQAIAKRNAVLESTGYAAGFTSQQLDQMASSLQKVTTYGDETTIAMQAVLLTFKQIGGKQFEKAQELILDMAKTLNMDLKSAALQVGKALNDPVLGVSALSEAGIQFTEDQKNMIKAMVKANDIIGAQTVILGELESQFGGVARAVALTRSGQLEQMANAYGDLKEQIGGLILKLTSPGVKEALGALTELNTLLSSDDAIEKTKAKLNLWEKFINYVLPVLLAPMKGFSGFGKAKLNLEYQGPPEPPKIPGGSGAPAAPSALSVSGKDVLSIEAMDAQMRHNALLRMYEHAEEEKTRIKKAGWEARERLLDEEYQLEVDTWEQSFRNWERLISYPMTDFLTNFIMKTKTMNEAWNDMLDQMKIAAIRFLASAVIVRLLNLLVGGGTSDPLGMIWKKIAGVSQSDAGRYPTHGVNLGGMTPSSVNQVNVTVMIGDDVIPAQVRIHDKIDSARGI